MLQLYLLMMKKFAQRHSHIQDNTAWAAFSLHIRLPFELTSAQKRVMEEIRRDMDMDVPMQRLVQGDVGRQKRP